MTEPLTFLAGFDGLKITEANSGEDATTLPSAVKPEEGEAVAGRSFTTSALDRDGESSGAEDGLSGQGSPRSLAQTATQEAPAPAEATLRRDSQRALPPTVDRPVSRGGPNESGQR